MSGKYFDDWVIGQEFITPGRTMTETDIVMFAGSTGDYNELHTNSQFMENHQFGQRIGHGLLGLSIAHGLWFRTGFLEGVVIAFLGVEDWKFQAPFFAGDTLRVRFKAVEARPSKSRPDRGIVKWYLEVINQKDEVVQSGHKVMMLHRKSEAK
jgi:acyl dehydratase